MHIDFKMFFTCVHVLHSWKHDLPVVIILLVVIVMNYHDTAVVVTCHVYWPCSTGVKVCMCYHVIVFILTNTEYLIRSNFGQIDLKSTQNILMVTPPLCARSAPQLVQPISMLESMKK